MLFRLGNTCVISFLFLGRIQNTKGRLLDEQGYVVNKDIDCKGMILILKTQ